ncbi:MAG: methyltransferase domain-containing protein [Vicinamibacteria bacterium]|nr:methyltransferase domain-containing protein [Vicinamibacteria bacterium]
MEAQGTNDQDTARRYFDALAQEYSQAFEQRPSGFIGGLVNRFFRGPTFLNRMRMLDELLRGLDLQGRRVLDLGCGSGQVSLLAASLGAEVDGIDIAPRMLAIARATAERTGLSARARFSEGDITAVELPAADVTLLIGVIEYYRAYEAVIARAAAATRQTLVIAHTNRVWYRMALRKLLFGWQGAQLYFHPMENVCAAARQAGWDVERRIRAHAFTILVLSPTRKGALVA